MANASQADYIARRSKQPPTNFHLYVGWELSGSLRGDNDSSEIFVNCLFWQVKVEELWWVTNVPTGGA